MFSVGHLTVTRKVFLGAIRLWSIIQHPRRTGMNSWLAAAPGALMSYVSVSTVWFWSNVSQAKIGFGPTLTLEHLQEKANNTSKTEICVLRRKNTAPTSSPNLPRDLLAMKNSARAPHVQIDGAPPIFSRASLPALVPHSSRESLGSSSRPRHSASSFHALRPSIGIERWCASCNLAASTFRCGRHDLLPPPRGRLCVVAYKIGLWPRRPVVTTPRPEAVDFCRDLVATTSIWPMAPTTGVNNNVGVQPVMAIAAHPIRAATVFLGLRHMSAMLQIPRLQWCFPSLTTPLRPWKMWTMLTCFAVVRI